MVVDDGGVIASAAKTCMQCVKSNIWDPKNLNVIKYVKVVDYCDMCVCLGQM